jgi:acyl-CoA reductase-like NAD-dependent aldehyde dehydrogenase
MPIIRVTKKQIEEANKARAAALEKDEEFRHYEEEQRQRLLREAASKGKEQPS